MPGQPPRGDRPGSVQIIRPLTPCLVTGRRGGGGNPDLSVGDPRGNWGQGSGSGSFFPREKVTVWACLQRNNNVKFSLEHGWNSFEHQDALLPGNGPGAQLGCFLLQKARVEACCSVRKVLFEGIILASEKGLELRAKMKDVPRM